MASRRINEELPFFTYGCIMEIKYVIVESGGGGRCGKFPAAETGEWIFTGVGGRRSG